MSIDLKNREHQLIARELAFTTLALVFVTVPAAFTIGIGAWAAVGCLLAIAALHPRALIFAVPAAIPLSFATVDFGTFELNMLEILVTAAVVGFAPRFLIGAWQVSKLPAADRHHIMRQLVPDRLAASIAILMLLGGAVAILWMADPDHAAESLRTFRWTILFPIAYFFLAAPVLIERSQLREIAAGMFIAGAVVSSVIAIIDGLLGGGIQADAVTRLSGIAPHPNALALVLDRVLVLGVLISVLYRERVSGIWLYPSLLITVVTFLTFSRGAILGVVAALVIMFLLARARRFAVAAAGMSITGIAGMIVIAPERTLSLLGGGSGSLRLELWKSSLSMIADHPLTGVGPDQFLYQYLPRYVSPEAWPERFTSHPHNLVLDSWLSLGIIGVIVLGLTGVLLARHIRAALRHGDRLSLAAAGALLAAAIHGMVDQSYFLPELAMSAWLLICLLASDVTKTRETRQIDASESEG